MYKKYRFKDSDVHIYIQEMGEELKLIQSDNSEPLSRFWNDDFKCLINCSYFTRDYVLGRNQGILKNDRPALDDIIDLVIKKDNSYIIKDLNEWDWIDSQCGFSVAAVLIKDFKDVKEISTAIVGESKLTAINPQTAIARVDGKWAFIVVDGRSHQSRGINGYDLRDFIKSNFERVELLALLDGGGSSQMMMAGVSKNRPSDGVERYMFNGLAFFKKKEEKEEIKVETNGKYTALFAHLGEPSQLKVGDKVKYGDFIGEMGNTGISQGIHLHLAVFEKTTTYLPTLAEATPNSDFKPNKEECLLFKNNDLFINEGVHREAIISCGWLGYKNHYAIDYIAGGRGFKRYPLIHWNRQHTGSVIGTGYHNSYGNYVLINYGKNEEAKKEDSQKNEINALKSKIKELEGYNTTLTKNNEKLTYKLTKIKEIMED